ncbi:MAG: hypothetical protein UX99_C0024G0005 [Candidatus Amesbacteria bacterium GW2011_GWB1_47_26]|uniref:Uncharacterized protein n=1 Tax=Candidatus Amesbacteria bacterium GW2011_GWC2_45_19 TaxID=1618366 RepID=A0A0G1PDG4_9BACT|nr:MAG: hypothetical protein UX05_C0001G0097 [Candidatus Amesbacteria bacterium GW2011_GWC2_45_19]KKU38262.1 MAG: hypothetical protein UX52_C0008G0003 [Candidatus Amesbacteria bacterium GW2011_GWA1_46_35]KKU69549.1 MAG: hypothetical protein UX93_C0001G0134 [Microgenomates group bacterium GW2011_GWC1_47_20]KKU74048.1 MAG: hypothetical protein UX99_C0024G0005 [Candidatus Amesbacteria bacterium GW2011_GWB1_47_26]KKU79661.1 MAG: hypothetical protein UY06_C0016G0004 [Candidatus Amesbacteria bacteriu
MLILAVVSVFSTLALWVPVGMQKVYENFDGLYYVVIAKSWYDKAFIGNNFSFPLPLEYYPAHFPLYPALIWLFGGSPLSAVMINLVVSAVTALAIYKIFEEFKWGNPLIAGLVWLFAWPRMWVVRSIGSPETLFILFVVIALYAFRKKSYWLAAIAGALATLTKSPGILLFPAFVLASKFDKKIWPTLLIPAALVAVFGFYYLRTGDFWAYFNSGDNIHLQALPFKVFDSNQPWVGNWWLEDVLWMYLIGAVGVIRAFRKSAVWGWWGAIFYAVILFVSHRDIARYSLPMVPVVILGLTDVLEKKEVRWALLLLIIPMYFYSLNFLAHNTAAISDWTPFFSR